MGLGFRDGFGPQMDRIEFIHDQPWDIKKIKRESINGNRYYVTPEGAKYPSVSTVVGHSTKASIMAWRKRVGAEEANKVSVKASRHGTAVHSICEDYLNNDENFLKEKTPGNIEAFRKLKPLLDEGVEKVFALEASLYSDYLKVAGQCDLACVYEGKNTIVDFKTSAKWKKEEWIQNYFQQAAMYAVMAEERTGINFPQIAILISVADSNKPQVFVKKRDDYIWDAIKLIGTYYDEVYNKDVRQHI